MQVKPDVAFDWPALTVHQSWADGIIYYGKDVENRTWRTNYRGPLLIHAGRRVPASLRESQPTIAAITGVPVEQQRSPIYQAIIGYVELVDCVKDHPSPWAVPGEWHWVLANPTPLTTSYPCPGRLNLWRPGIATIENILATQP